MPSQQPNGPQGEPSSCYTALYLNDHSPILHNSILLDVECDIFFAFCQLHPERGSIRLPGLGDNQSVRESVTELKRLRRRLAMSKITTGRRHSPSQLTTITCNAGQLDTVAR